MREPIREPSPQEPRVARGPEPLRPGGPAIGPEAAPFFGRGLVEWSPTWGGMFVSLGVLLLLSALGVAIGVGTGATGVAIWGAISLIVAFFVGGWFTGRTLTDYSSVVASAHGLLVWAVSTVFVIVFTIMTTLLGVGALASAVRTALLANVLGPFTGIAAPAAPGAASTAVTSSWITFIVLLLGVAACVIGAVVGNSTASRQIVYH